MEFDVTIQCSILYKERHVWNCIFLHSIFVNFYSNAGLFRKCYETVFYPFTIIMNNLLKHGIGMEIGLPFKY